MDSELKEYFIDVEQSELDEMALNDLKSYYSLACQEEESEIAAKLCRTIRNKLLRSSDDEMLIDRTKYTAPEGDSFEDWLPFLQQLASTLNGKWAVYRQKLRDLPEQKEFPLETVFPNIEE